MGVFDLFRFGRSPAKRTEGRAYAAAKPTRFASDWVMSPLAADVDIRQGLSVLRARSRQECQNNGYVRNFLRELQTNVVGHKGIALRAKPMNPPRSLGNNTDAPAVDRLAKLAIEKAWRDWGKKINSPEVTGRLSWTEILATLVTNCARDGEFIVWERPGDRVNRFRYTLRILDPSILDPEYNRDLPDGRRIRMGIEQDSDRRPIAYHFRQDFDSADDYYSAVMSRRYTRIPAEQIIHGFINSEGVGQSRGVPWVSAGLLRFNMLSGYEEAELVAARSAASKMGFIIDAPDDEDGYTGDSDPDDADDGYEFIEESDPGYVGVLKHGSEWRNYDPQHPTTAYKDFVKTNLRAIAAGLGISYNALSSDLEGVNYSSLREGRLREASVWMALQEWLIETVVDRVFENWLMSALIAKQITLDNGISLDVSRSEKYLNVDWSPRRWAWVDPQKEVVAMRERIKLNYSSVSEEIRASGREPEEVFREIAEERTSWEALGIVPPELNDTLGTESDGSPDPENAEDANQ